MRTFREFLESIIDVKRDPKITRLDKLGHDHDDDPEHYDYDDITDDALDDKPNYSGKKLGLTAQYPLALASEKMRGFQVKTPEELFQQRDNVFTDKLRGEERLHTLLSKVYADEPMTNKELRELNKKLEETLAQTSLMLKTRRNDT